MAQILHGEYFPFDLPSLAFYRRGHRLGEWLKTLLKTFPRQDFSTLATMSRHLSALEEGTDAVAAQSVWSKQAPCSGNSAKCCG